MHIGFDITTYAEVPRCGVGRYQRNLATALLRAAPQHRYELFYSPAGILPDRETMDRLAASFPGAEIRAVYGEFVPHLPGELNTVRRLGLSRVFRVPDALIRRACAWANARLDLPWMCRLRAAGRRRRVVEEPDLLHQSGFIIHYPYRTRCNVLTVHDVIPFKFPEWVGEDLSRLFQRALRMAPRCEAVITVSDFTRRDLMGVVRLRPERVSTVYEAPEEHFRVIEDRRSLEATLQPLGLKDRRFLICVSFIETRKNLGCLLRSFAAARKLLNAEDLPLVLVTGRHRERDKALAELVRQAGAEQVVNLGEVEDETLVALLNSALAFIFPSLYEGFGFPPLEAMASGCPVICSNSSSLPELAGDAALTVDPADEAALAAAIVRVCRDAGLREDLRRRGLARAARFSWRRAAEETLEVYEQAAREASRK